MRRWKNLFCFLLAAILIISLASCGKSPAAGEGRTEALAGSESDTQVGTDDSSGENSAAEAAADAKEHQDIMILFTSDVHCGIDQGFGYTGLQQVRDTYEAQGYTTLLVDDGDSIQGESIGMMSKGEAIIKLMNDLKYDVAIPGDHEFDYGMEQFMKLAGMADFPYISCNFCKEGKPVFKPYLIKEVSGKKIAFVGVTTPSTITSSTPKFFQNEDGEFIYSFLQDKTGQALYDAVQSAVDDARKEGADYVYVMGHLGMNAEDSPWTYADVISHTNGIDVFLDGHSHDTDQVVMKNKDGKEVVRSACGTKLNCIGYSRISLEKGIEETNVLSWPNQQTVPEVFDIHNEISEKINIEQKALEVLLGEVAATSEVDLTIYDPKETDDKGQPVRMIRRAETNLGDLCADVFRIQLGADIGISNGGSIRQNITKGDITYGNIISVFPFNNSTYIVTVTGQQILDALEWGARALPEENGAFLQVSGMSYEIDTSIKSGCKEDENGMLTGIEGDRRVKNVRVGDDPLDPDKKYTVAGIDYILIDHGDGQTAFDGAENVTNSERIDNQVMINYIKESLGGKVGEGYTNPYGQGRIKIREEKTNE